MTIVALAGQKGGVGKSTISISLAVEAFSRGKKVLAVDADPQGTMRTWGEVAAEAGQQVPTVVAMGAAMHRADQLPQLSASYDMVFIDCPPRAGDIQRSALMVADVVVIPCGPSAADAWALATTVDLVNEARTIRPELRGVVLITRKQPRTSLGKGARDVLEQSGLPVLSTELGYRIAYQEALAAGQGVTTYAPRNDASLELKALYQELFPEKQEAPRRGRRKA